MVVSLQNNPFVRIHNFPDAEEFIESRLKARIVTSSRRLERLNIKANYYALPNSELWFCSYGEAISLQFDESEYLRLQMNICGNGSTQIARREIEVTQNQSVFSSAGAQINFGADYEQMVFRLNRPALMKKIFALTGVPATKSLAFEALVDHANPRFQFFLQTLNSLIAHLNSSCSEIPAMVILELEQTLFTSLLCACPNNYSGILEKRPADNVPPLVHRVEGYIEENWNHPVKIEDLVHITGRSARSIFRAFKEIRGYSPLTFTKQIRLQRAQQMLVQGDVATITEVAFSCGFSDLSRFSRAYARAFGILPSRALRKK